MAYPRGIVFREYIVLAYRHLGILALVGILVGLSLFLIVNVFYWFDDSWVRPVTITGNDRIVVETEKRLQEESLRLDDLQRRLDEQKLEVSALERNAIADSSFVVELKGHSELAGRSLDAILARRSLQQAKLTQARLRDRLALLSEQIKRLEVNVDRQRVLVDKIRTSPFLLTHGTTTVVFSPYENLEEMTSGAPIYACSLGLILCSKVGEVVEELEGEVTHYHPHNDSLRRGVYLRVQLKDASAATSEVLFVGERPLWIL